MLDGLVSAASNDHFINRLMYQDMQQRSSGLKAGRMTFAGHPASLTGSGKASLCALCSTTAPLQQPGAFLTLKNFYLLQSKCSCVSIHKMCIFKNLKPNYIV